MNGGVWSFLTHVRLAIVRGVFWSAWHVVLAVMVVFLRPDHPARVYFNGARHTVLQTYLSALHHATGPRYTRTPIVLLLGVMITLLTLGVSFGYAETAQHGLHFHYHG